MEFWTIVSIIITSLLILFIILWFYWLIKKQKILGISSKNEIKKNWVSFLGLLILYALTTSIAIGLETSYKRTRKAFNEITVDHKRPHIKDPGNSIQVNSGRVKNFDRCSKYDSPCGATEGWNNNIKWWTGKDQEGNDVANLPSFIDWVNEIITPTLDVSGNFTNETELALFNNYVLNTHGWDNPNVESDASWKDYGIWSDDNAWAMQIYVMDMFAQYPSIQDGPNKNYFGTGYNTSTYRDFKALVDGKTKTLRVLKISDKNNEFSRSQSPATSSYDNFHKHYVNDIYYENLSKDVNYNENNNQLNLNNNEVILTPNFVSKNNIKLNDELLLIDSIISNRTLKVKGTGMRSSDISSKETTVSSNRNYNNMSFAYVNEKTFNEIVWQSLINDPDMPSIDDPTNEDKKSKRKWLISNNKVNFSLDYGLAYLYSKVDQGLVDYADGYFDDKRSQWIRRVTHDYGDRSNFDWNRDIFGNFFKWTSPDVGTILGDKNHNKTIENPTTNICGNWFDALFFNKMVDGATWLPNLSWLSLYKEIDTQSIYSGPILIVFIIINIFITIIFMKRRINNNIKNIGTMKALGHRTSGVTGSYMMYPLSISILGGIIAMFASLGTQLIIMKTLNNGIIIGTGAVIFPFSTIFSAVIMPIIILSIIITLITYLDLKNNTMSSLRGEKESKPNILVRGWSKVSPSNFMISYRVKNIFRQMGKSAFVFSTIFISSSMILVGGSLSSFKAHASHTTTQSMFDLDGNKEKGNIKWNLGTNQKENIPQSELDQNIEDGKYDPYTFTDDPSFALEKAVRILTFGSDAKTVENWEKDVVKYMYENTLDNKYITTGLDISKILKADIGDTSPGINSLINYLIHLMKNDGDRLGEILLIIGEDWTWNSRVSIISALNILYKEIQKDANKPCTDIEITNCLAKEFINNSKQMTEELVNLWLSFGTVDGFLPAFIYTLAIYITYNDPLKPLDDYKISTYNYWGKKVDTWEHVTFTDIFNKMLQPFIVNMLSSLLNGFSQTYVLPGTSSYKDGSEKPLRFYLHLPHINGPSIKGGAQLQWFYDNKWDSLMEEPLYDQPNKSLKGITDEYNDRIDSVDNNSEIVIPSLVSTFDKATIVTSNHEIGEKTGYSTSANFLDWSKEKSSGNPNWTWKAIRYNHDEYINDDIIRRDFKKVNGKLEVPVVFNKNGSPQAFMFVQEIVGYFESYIPFGDQFYIDYNSGLGKIMNNTSFNIMINKYSKSQNFSLFSKYQSFWSSEWKTNDPGSHFLLNDSFDSRQPISKYATSLPIPIPISFLYMYIDSQYNSLQTTLMVFVVISLIITIWMVIILTKEIIDGTKKEASTLKALGYGNFGASSLIVDGSNIVMILGFLVSIPIVASVVSLFGQIFTALIGMPVTIAFSTSILMMLIAGLISVICIVYMLGYYSFKKVSPLQALQ